MAQSRLGRQIIAVFFRCSMFYAPGGPRPTAPPLFYFRYHRLTTMHEARVRQIERRVGAGVQARNVKVHFVYGASPEAIAADIEEIKVRFDYHEREDDHLFVCIVETEDAPRPEAIGDVAENLETLSDRDLEDQIEEIERTVEAKPN
jgi:hypothetical protein